MRESKNAENETVVSEADQTFYNPSDVKKSCEHFSFEATCDRDLDINIKSFHSEKFQCEYCVFILYSVF